jgi:GTPase SAR1 family protein
MTQKLEEKLYDYMVDVTIIGDSGVGKTSIANRYTQGTFRWDVLSTMGVGCSIKNETREVVKKDRNKFMKKMNYRLRIWNTVCVISINNGIGRATPLHGFNDYMCFREG